MVLNMNNFRKLVEQIINENDMTVEFFVKHGINPSICNLPLYNAASDSLITVFGPDKKDSEFFLDKEHHPVNDNTNKVMVANISEYRDPDTNRYIKDTSDKHSITVTELKDILADERNQETLTSIGAHDIDLDTEDQRNQVLNKYNDKIEQQKQADNKKFEDWFEANKDYFDISDKQLGKRLYNLHLKGYSNDEIEKSFDLWRYNNKETLNKIENEIKKDDSRSKESKEVLLFNFKNAMRSWYKDDMKNQTYQNPEKASMSTLLHATDWWKENQKQNITEASFTQNSSSSITDMHEIREILPQLDIDPKFITVPITIQGKYDKNKYSSAKEDPNSAGDDQVTIKSFPNAENVYKIIEIKKQLETETDQDKINELLLQGDNLMKHTTVKVKGNTDTYEINLDKLQNLSKLPINQNAELDTTDYRLHDKQQFNTLNAGVGRYVDIPEEIVIEMLKVVQEEYEDEYPYGFDLVKHYLDNKNSPKDSITTDALNKYNTNGDGNIRRFYNKQRNSYNFRGLVPYEAGVKIHPTIPKKRDFNNLVSD